MRMVNSAWRALVLMAGLLMVCATACSGDPFSQSSVPRLEDVPVEDSSPAVPDSSVTVARPRASKLTDDQQNIIAAYQGYFTKCYPEASASPADSLDILGECATGPQLEVAAQGIADAVLRGDTFDTQQMKFRPQPPSIVGEEAVVHDCLDSRDVGRVHNTTGEVLTRGVDKDSTVITLRQEDDVWKVFAIESHSDPGRFC